MTDKEEQITDLDKKGLSGENINNGKAMEDLSLKDQHCFQVMLYVNHFKSTEINVGVDGGVVIVNGHHEARTDAHGFIRRKFSRKYNLPDDVKPENLIAVFSENGILTIRASDEKGHKEYDEENSNQLENLYATFKPVQFKDGVPKEDPTADSGDISTETADSDVSTETADSGDVSTEDPTACFGVSTEGAKVKQTSAASQAEVMTPAVVAKSPKSATRSEEAKSPKSATRSEEAKSPKSATRSEEAKSDAKPPRATTKSEAAKPPNSATRSEEVKSDPKSSKSATRSEEAKPDPKPPRSTSKSEAAKSPKSATRSEEAKSDAKSSKSATRSEEAKSDPKSSKSATRSEEAKPDPKPPRSTTTSEAPKSATRSEEAKSDAKPKSATRSEGRGKS